MPNLHVFSDNSSFVNGAADFIAGLADQAITERGRVTIALSGGNTPRQIYARLATAGNRIINALTGEGVLMRGVNRSGMEYSEPDEEGFLTTAGITHAEMRWISREWQANIVRIPFNQDWALNGRRAHEAEVYLRNLDRIVSLASRYRMYTLLDLQWLDADHPFGANRQFVPPLPNPDTPRLWATLARRYRDEPAVLFDILNEPHDRQPDDPFPLWRPDATQYPDSQRRVGMEEWQPWARLLVDTISGEHPDALIFVSGINWGYDLRGFPLDRLNLVYSTHVYSNKGGNWDAAFGDLSRAYPVFAGEWGGNEDEVEWGRRLSGYFDERGMGWTAWSWSDQPYLVGRYVPTGFGSVVKDAMNVS